VTPYIKEKRKVFEIRSFPHCYSYYNFQVYYPANNLFEIVIFIVFGVLQKVFTSIKAEIILD
jgi:hypothetical protein